MSKKKTKKNGTKDEIVIMKFKVKIKKPTAKQMQQLAKLVDKEMFGI